MIDPMACLDMHFSMMGPKLVTVSQRLQYPLIREYTLNYSRIPNLILRKVP